jgi:hypothetical protein
MRHPAIRLIPAGCLVAMAMIAATTTWASTLPSDGDLRFQRDMVERAIAAATKGSPAEVRLFDELDSMNALLASFTGPSPGTLRLQEELSR